VEAFQFLRLLEERFSCDGEEFDRRFGAVGVDERVRAALDGVAQRLIFPLQLLSPRGVFQGVRVTELVVTVGEIAKITSRSGTSARTAANPNRCGSRSASV